MRTVKLAAVATAGVLALTGCVTGSPQVAAYVGDTEIPQSEVDNVSKVLVEAGGSESSTVARNVVVQVAIQNEIAKLAAAAGNITVTDAQRQEVLAQAAGLEPLLQNPLTADFVSDYVNTVIILNTEAGKAAAPKVVAENPVRVNPRVGVWDPQQLVLIEESSGSLSEIAPFKQE